MPKTSYCGTHFYCELEFTINARTLQLRYATLHSTHIRGYNK